MKIPNTPEWNALMLITYDVEIYTRLAAYNHRMYRYFVAAIFLGKNSHPDYEIHNFDEFEVAWPGNGSLGKFDTLEECGKCILEHMNQ